MLRFVDVQTTMSLGKEQKSKPDLNIDEKQPLNNEEDSNISTCEGKLNRNKIYHTCPIHFQIISTSH